MSIDLGLSSVIIGSILSVANRIRVFFHVAIDRVNITLSVTNLLGTFFIDDKILFI